MTHLQRIMRIFAHLIRNIESPAMPVTLDRIETDLGMKPRAETGDTGRPQERMDA